MGHTEPDFLAALESAHQSRLEAREVDQDAVDAKTRETILTVDTGDIAELVYQSDAIQAAVMTGDKALMGEVFSTLVMSFARRLAEFDLYQQFFTDDEASAMAVLNAGIAKRAGRAA